MSLIPISRGALLMPETPDPCARTVIEAHPTRRKNELELVLECGHRARRRFLCRPRRVFCAECRRRP